MSPSPANSPLSKMEKLPESSVSLELFSSQTARSGVGSASLHRVTWVGGQLLLEDGDHGRLVFVDGDRLGEGVLEEVVEGVGGDVAFVDSVRGAVDAPGDAVALTDGTAGAADIGAVCVYLPFKRFDVACAGGWRCLRKPRQSLHRVHVVSRPVTAKVSKSWRKL